MPPVQIVDRFGRPIQREVLTQEVAAATVGGVRSPISGYPGDGLNPVRLAQILRAADMGDPVRYLELAETIEERDPHYLGVLGTRRRSVSQIEVTVEAASEAPHDVRMAEMVREWIDRDELAEEMFDILDCIGKGYSFTEIIWDTSGGQWMPARLEWRDPRWFRFSRHDLATPIRLDDSGAEIPLEPGKFIFSVIRAKSGLALRSGLARVATWGWMFKAYTQRDWAIFTQTYGQPLRVGKWAAGASEADKDTLFRAVANIAGDCAAIIPDSMLIDFVESKNVGSSSDHYEKRADWLDRQISKAVLGQTTSTDAVGGGHAVSKEHRLVQEDIETADARAMAAILNRDLIRPWMQLEFGPQLRYPRLKIARPKREDLKTLADALSKMVPLGLRVGQAEVRSHFGLSEPTPGAEILQSAPPRPAAPEDSNPARPLNGDPAVFKRGTGSPRPMTALQQEAPSAGKNSGGSVEAFLMARMMVEAQPEIGRMIGAIEAMLEAATSLEEFREMLLAGFEDIDSSGLAARLAEGMIAAGLAGRAEVAAEDEGDAGA